MCRTETPFDTLTTPRLCLRPFTEADYPLILRISSDPATTRYLYYWGRIGWTPEADARRFLDYALKNWQKRPIRAREFCVVLKETGEAIGDGSVEWVENAPGTAEIGWILLPAYRGQGYATEMGRELLRAAFDRLGAEQVIAHCDARNAPSYRVMERLGMVLDHVEPGARPAKATDAANGDECTYVISRQAWTLAQAWEKYHALSCSFLDFVPLADLRSGDVSLALERTAPADPVKQYVPAYHFAICLKDQPIGKIDLRIGYPDSLFYGGQIGYSVDEAYRGHGYAGAACRLLSPILRAHGMRAAIITNSTENRASRRVCEKLGCRLLCQADVPGNHKMYEEGIKQVNVFLYEAE